MSTYYVSVKNSKRITTVFTDYLWKDHNLWQIFLNLCIKDNSLSVGYVLYDARWSKCHIYSLIYIFIQELFVDFLYYRDCHSFGCLFLRNFLTYISRRKVNHSLALSLERRGIHTMSVSGFLDVFSELCNTQKWTLN